jgi:hypothetical protein
VATRSALELVRPGKCAGRSEYAVKKKLNRQRGQKCAVADVARGLRQEEATSCSNPRVFALEPALGGVISKVFPFNEAAAVRVTLMESSSTRYLWYYLVQIFASTTDFGGYPERCHNSPGACRAADLACEALMVIVLKAEACNELSPLIYR